jgi:hypothetical protein
VKLKLIFVCLAIALVQITPLNAQSVSPEGRYTRKAGGAGDMRVEKTGKGWRVFVRAAGSPMAKERTAADCMLIAEGEIKGNTFQGEIKYTPDTWDTWEKPSADNAAEPRDKITITFTPQSATPSPVGSADPVCGHNTGMWDRYTKRRK